MSKNKLYFLILFGGIFALASSSSIQNLFFKKIAEPQNQIVEKNTVEPDLLSNRIEMEEKRDLEIEIKPLKKNDARKKIDEAPVLVQSLDLQNENNSNIQNKETPIIDHIVETQEILPERNIASVEPAEVPEINNLESEEPQANASSSAETGNTPDDNSFHAYSKFTVATSGQFYEFNGTEKSNGRSANLISNFSPGIELGSEQIWSENFSTSIFYSGEKISIANTSTRTILGGDAYLSEISLSANYDIGEKTKITATAAQSEVLLHRAPNSSSLQMEKSSKTILDIKVDQRIAQIKPLELHLGLSAGTILPGDSNGYKSEWGNTFGANLKVVHKSESGSAIDSSLFYKHANLSTDAVKFGQSEVGAKFSYTWAWGRE